VDWQNVILPATATATLILAVWIAVRRHPGFRFAALWMGLLILPPLYLRGIAGGEIAHDRYLYLPSLGLCVLVAAGLARLRGGRAAVVILACVAALGVYRASEPWSSDVELFQHDLRVAPDNMRAQRQLALAFAAQGRCAEAIPLLDRLRQRREDPRILLGLGTCYCVQSRFDEAEPLLERTIALTPRYQLPYITLIGMRLAQKRMDDAETLWRRALSVRFGATDARGLHLLGGQILKARGNLVDAAAEFRLELAGDPENEEAARQLEDVEWTLRSRRTAGQ
jgi:tetratricopeptide (TPR) repeat protein